MAQVTIRITDASDNEMGVSITIASKPPFPGPAKKDQSLTTAQECALRFMDSLRRSPDVDRFETDETDETDEDDA